MENNNGINIFGYSYDNKQNKYVVNEDQAKVVKTIYEFYNKYYLNLDEIEELIKGNIDIDYIIASRIERICEELKEQQLESKNPFDKLNIANLLKCAYGLREHLINHFTELNKKIEYIDNTNDEIDVEGAIAVPRPPPITATFLRFSRGVGIPRGPAKSSTVSPASNFERSFVVFPTA